MEDLWNGRERRASQKKRRRDPRPSRAPSPFPTWSQNRGERGAVSSKGERALAVGGSLARGGVVEFDVAGGVGGKGKEESVAVGTVDAILGEGSVCTEVVEVILGSYMNMERNKKGREKGFFLLLYVWVTDKTREPERKENK
jgi:hypothetical protein